MEQLPEHHKQCLAPGRKALKEREVWHSPQQCRHSWAGSRPRLGQECCQASRLPAEEEVKSKGKAEVAWQDKSQMAQAAAQALPCPACPASANLHSPTATCQAPTSEAAALLPPGPANKWLAQLRAGGRANVPSWHTPTAALEESWAWHSKPSEMALDLHLPDRGTSPCQLSSLPSGTWLPPLPVAWHWLLRDMRRRRLFCTPLGAPEVSGQKDSHQGLLDKLSVLCLGVTAEPQFSGGRWKALV